MGHWNCDRSKRGRKRNFFFSRRFRLEFKCRAWALFPPHLSCYHLHWSLHREITQLTRSRSSTSRTTEYVLTFYAANFKSQLKGAWLQPGRSALTELRNQSQSLPTIAYLDLHWDLQVGLAYSGELDRSALPVHVSMHSKHAISILKPLEAKPRRPYWQNMSPYFWSVSLIYLSRHDSARGCSPEFCGRFEIFSKSEKFCLVASG